MVGLIEHEPLINVVIASKRKLLTSLTKRYVGGLGGRSSPDADESDHRRRGGAYPRHGTHAERGKPIMLLDARKAFRKKDRWHGRQRLREEAKASR